jgi:hypothetical protein
LGIWALTVDLSVEVRSGPGRGSSARSATQTAHRPFTTAGTNSPRTLGCGSMIGK